MRNALNIYQRKDGRYEGRIPYGRDDKGRLKYKYLYSRNLSALKDKMLAAYTCGEKYNVSASSKTLSELCNEWLSCAKLRVRHSSFCCYEKNVRTHILPYFKKLKYSELNSVKANSFIEYLTVSGRADGNGGLSPKTVRDVIVLLRSVARYAENEYGYRDPMRNIAVPKQVKKDIPILDRNERRRLQNHLMQNTDRTSLGILFAMYTGMRIGELCALTTDDIDPVNGTIHVSKTVQRIANTAGLSKTKVMIGSPKSANSERDIPLPEFLMPLLKGDLKSGVYLLSGTDKPVEPRTMQNRFKAALKKCGIRNVNFHLLRHTYATACIENGIDAKTVSELLGHSSVQITLNRYMHSDMDMKKRYLETFSYIS